MAPTQLSYTNTSKLNVKTDTNQFGGKRQGQGGLSHGCEGEAHHHGQHVVQNEVPLQLGSVEQLHAEKEHQQIGRHRDPR